MAQKTVVTLVDDTDGTESDDVGTVAFSYEGADYEIDLTPENKAIFDDRVEMFIEKGRRVGSSRGRVRGRGTGSPNGYVRRDRKQTGDIRAWAKQQGHEVSERGRIPVAIQAEYEAAH